ncbi:MAG: transcriptional repressor [Ignavibacteria bacterium]|jgi:Fur family ferric uptake transcriptional regulator
MNEKKIKNLLADNKLRKTNIRTEVLNIFLNTGCALSYFDIKKKLNGDFDKVTVYRTIHKFLEKKLIHEVPSPSSRQMYAYSNCNGEVKNNNHAHFICKECGNVFCLKDVSLNNIKLPVEHNVDAINVTVNGVCATCRMDNKA